MSLNISKTTSCTENDNLSKSGMFQVSANNIFWIKTKYQNSVDENSLFYMLISNVVRIWTSDVYKKIIVILRLIFLYYLCEKHYEKPCIKLSGFFSSKQRLYHG